MHRIVAGWSSALLLAAGGVLLVATPAHAATGITTVTQLNQAIAQANLGNTVELVLESDIDVTEDLEELSDGTLTIDGAGFAVRRAGVHAMFSIRSTATFSASNLVLDAAGQGPALIGAGAAEDAAASPVISLDDVEVYGTLDELSSAISTEDVSLSITGSSYIHDSTVGLNVSASFGTTILTGLRVDAVSDCGIEIALAATAGLEASGLSVSGAGCNGLALVLFDPDTSATIADSTFAGNAGGVFISNAGGSAEIRNSRITGSSDEQLFVLAAGGATNVVGATIDNADEGGAYPPVNILQAGGDVTIAHSTITEHTVTDIPVVVAYDCGCGGSVTIEHTIIAGNTLLGTATDLYLDADPDEPTPQELTWSLIGTIEPGTAAYSLATDPANHNLFNEVAAIDPGLDGPALHGGQTENYLPATGSPVVNAGDPAFVGPPDTDQRGLARISGEIIDIGSVEAQFAGQPTGLAATPGDGQVALTWSAPTPGDAPIEDYVIEYREIGAPSWSTFLPGPGTTPSVTVTGLTNGDEYEFRVAAETGYGSGPMSTTVTSTPKAGPAVTLTPASGAVGDHIQLSGTGFDPETEYTIVFNSDPVVLGQATSGPTGTLSFGFAIPASASAGAHTVTVTLDDRVVASAAITVRSLPATGPAGGVAPALGVLLLVAGLALAVVARKRLEG